jgi:hypothetical protein
MVIARLTGMAAGPAVALSVALAFVFGYGLTMRPLIAGGTGLRAALGLAFAADTVSITVMETIDNATILLVPGRWRPARAICCSGRHSPAASRSPGS